MLGRSVGEECCREMLQNRGVEKCWTRVLERIVEKSVVAKFSREVLEKSVVEKCWRRVL